jgi:ketosteroid isomerase-like protein
MLHTRVVTALAVVLVFAASGANAQDKASASDALGHLKAVLEQYMQSYNTGNAHGAAAMFTEDGTFVTPGGALKGRKEIEAALAKRMKQGWTTVSETPSRPTLLPAT